MQRLWYVAYGSNLSLDRFRVYLRGGRPVGGAREYPGCRDPLGPDRDVPLMLPGGLRFVGVSSVWGGGMAVYDAGAVGQIAARAYLISAEQFLDILAQEMRLGARPRRRPDCSARDGLAQPRPGSLPDPGPPG